MEAQERAKLFRGGSHVVPVKPRHRLGMLDGVNDDAGVDHVHGVHPVLERRHDAEVPAAAAQRPEQVLVLAFAGGKEFSLGRDDVGREEVVAAEAILAAQVSNAAAEGQPGDAGRADNAAGSCQPEGMGRVVEVGPRRTRLRARRRGCRINPDAGHVGEIDDQGVNPRAKARGTVSSTADRQVQGVVPGEVDAGDDIGHLGYLGHRCRPLIDHAVEDCPCRVVAGVAGRDDLPADLPAQAIELCSVHFVYRRFRREIRPDGSLRSQPAWRPEVYLLMPTLPAFPRQGRQQMHACRPHPSPGAPAPNPY
ncbi:hypothetical protein SRABI128_04405 [Microbacterium sp. Bi128]|nr:hypothetical protein SRABI128_04405 [Microbacterium sp. Bi128]